MSGHRIASVALALAASGLVACEPPGVGDPCTPEERPMDEHGNEEPFPHGVVSLETRSLQCRTRTCFVYRFFPTEGRNDWRIRTNWPAEDDPRRPCPALDMEKFVDHFCKMRARPGGQVEIDREPPPEHPDWYCDFDMTLINLTKPFCTVKCAGAGRTFECPEGFVCRGEVDVGAEGLQGSYCVPARLADCDPFRPGEQHCCEELNYYSPPPES